MKSSTEDEISHMTDTELCLLAGQWIGVLGDFLNRLDFAVALANYIPPQYSEIDDRDVRQQAAALSVLTDDRDLETRERAAYWQLASEKYKSEDERRELVEKAVTLALEGVEPRKPVFD